jgi:hypothetical protein
MILTVEDIEYWSRALKESHEELRTLATLKEAEAAIFHAKMMDVQVQLIHMQEVLHLLLTNLAAVSGGTPRVES